MNIQIGRDSSHVYAMGHRVPHEQGVPELKRRCLETLGRLNDPPDLIEFECLWTHSVPAPVFDDSDDEPEDTPIRSPEHHRKGKRRR